MFELLHTITHALGICPDSAGFMMMQAYLEYWKWLGLKFSVVFHMLLNKA